MDIFLKNVRLVHNPNTPNEKIALDHISLHIPSGQFVAIMGAVGSGKTTLIHTICGLLRPLSGDIRVGSYPLNKKANRRRVWKEIGYLSQFPEHQVMEDTVFNHIAEGLNHLGLTRECLARRVNENLEAVGLSNERFRGLSPHHLSGGELRRAVLAGILAAEPKILILDEPTAGLDGWERLRVLSLLKQIHIEKKTTILYISHRLEEALEYSERILAVDHGQIANDFHPSEIRPLWHKLENMGFAKTPLLRLMDLLEERLSAPMPRDIYKEEQLAAYLTKLAGRD
ncbi:ATP-binding cassette domain-containing protein [Paenibacillus sp. M1]|uniref:ATP-binding cassette domain-containing protein n=1 Tax=Paenibacillus haidiansis TaxID=1574488 RepID=A0ABU7VYE6_9BACL